MSVIVRSEEIEIGKCIGKGAFGVVFRGKFRGRIVAVKKLLVDIDPDETMLMEFHQEISLCSRLHHENIVKKNTLFYYIYLNILYIPFILFVFFQG